MKSIPRCESLDPDTFIGEYLRGNSPVIVTDAMRDWPAAKLWTPEYFARRFGEVDVQVYNELFTLIDVCPLGSYLASNFGMGSGFSSREYVRGYVKFKDVEFVWADEIFQQLRSDWGHLYFFPRASFVLPASGPGSELSPVTDAFPYKGLFISGRGARTRLHRDPYGTDAILCQFYGEKRLLVYEPTASAALTQAGEFVDPFNIDSSRYPAFTGVSPAFEDRLRPGEVAFFPSGWFHDVLSLSDSISVTWNFVHSANSAAFEREVADPANTFDRDMLDYLGVRR